MRVDQRGQRLRRRWRRTATAHTHTIRWGGNERAVLHNDSDHVPERCSAHRARIRIHRHRRHRPLQAAGRFRRALSDRYRRARPEDGRDRCGRGHSDRRAGPPKFRRLPAAAGQAGHLLRPIHPHHRCRPHRGVDRHLEEDELLRRHLPRLVQGVVLDPRRALLHRGRDDRRLRRSSHRDRDRGAGDVDRGRDLFLQAVVLCRQAARPLRGAPGVHRPRRPAQRGGQLRVRRAARPVDIPHDVRLGRAGARPSRPRDVRLGGRIDQLPDRRRLPRYRLRVLSVDSGQRICT